jgi:hypothetical protein
MYWLASYDVGPRIRIMSLSPQAPLSLSRASTCSTGIQYWYFFSHFSSPAEWMSTISSSNACCRRNKHFILSQYSAHLFTDFGQCLLCFLCRGSTALHKPKTESENPPHTGRSWFQCTTSACASHRSNELGSQT